MKDKPRLIEIREIILQDNKKNAALVREGAKERGIFLVNVMGSPGSGKTSLILAMLSRLRGKARLAVIEADLDSMVDSEAVMRSGTDAVQIHTGGFCHLDAEMLRLGLLELEIDVRRAPDGHGDPPKAKAYNLVFVENVGNLICTAQVDTGAHLNIAVLSLPEGDDKPQKYPPMFRTADILIVNKIDYMPMQDFDMHAVEKKVKFLNPRSEIFPVSCRTGEGVEAWIGRFEEIRKDFNEGRDR